MSELSIYRLDGPYSWLVFLAIVLSNTVCVGQLFGTVGLMTSDYQRVVKVSYIHASLLGSVAIGVFLFSGMWAEYIFIDLDRTLGHYPLGQLNLYRIIAAMICLQYK